MNLRKTILEEHSKNQTMKIVRWVGKDKKRFAGLVKLFLHDEYRVIQRAAWPLSYCAEAHPELVKPWIGKIVRNLEKPDLPDAVVRNSLRFLQDQDVPEKYQGRLVNLAFHYLQSSNSPIAVKVFSMSTIANVAKKHPEIGNELATVIHTMIDERDPMEKGNGGIVARGKKVLKQIEKINLKK